MKPHKHAELIKQWADGAEIEACVGPDKWWFEEYPDWHPLVAYRIRPQPKPDVVRWCYATKLMGEDSRHGWSEECQPNLKLVICGETGKLKSAEVL